MGDEVRSSQTGKVSPSAHLRVALDEYLAARATRQQEHINHGRLLLAAVQMKVQLELRQDALVDLERTAGKALAGYDLNELPDDPRLVTELEQATCLADPAFAERAAQREQVIATFTELRKSALRGTGKRTLKEALMQAPEARRRAMSTLLSAMSFQSLGPAEASESKMTELMYEVIRLVNEPDTLAAPTMSSFEQTFDCDAVNEMEPGRPSWLRLQWFEATKLVRQLFSESRDSRALLVETRTELGGLLLEAAGRGPALLATKPKPAMAIASRIGQDIETAVLEDDLGHGLLPFTWDAAVSAARNLFDLQQSAGSDAGFSD